MSIEFAVVAEASSRAFVRLRGRRNFRRAPPVLTAPAYRTPTRSPEDQVAPRRASVLRCLPAIPYALPNGFEQKRGHFFVPGTGTGAATANTDRLRGAQRRHVEDHVRAPTGPPNGFEPERGHSCPRHRNRSCHRKHGQAPRRAALKCRRLYPCSVAFQPHTDRFRGAQRRHVEDHVRAPTGSPNGFGPERGHCLRPSPLRIRLVPGTGTGAATANTDRLRGAQRRHVEDCVRAPSPSSRTRTGMSVLRRLPSPD